MRFDIDDPLVQALADAAYAGTGLPQPPSVADLPEDAQEGLVRLACVAREHIAKAIERELYRYGDHPLLAETKFGWDSAIRTAARIARSEQA